MTKRTASQPSSPSRKQPTSRAAEPFVKKIEEYRKQLGWSENELAERAGMSRPRVAACVGKGDRPVDKVDVNQIAVALAVGFDKTPPTTADGRFSRCGTAYVDAMLNELLELAGFSAIRGFKESETIDYWTTERDVLRVGFFPWGDFMQPEFKGLSALIVEDVRVRLGIKSVDAVEIPLRLAGQSIRNREVDVFAPLLRQPSRMVDMACSSPIPHVHVGINAVLFRNDLEIAVPGKAGSRATGPSDVDWNRLNVHYISGGVPETLMDILTGRTLGAAVVGLTKRPHESFDAARKAVFDLPDLTEPAGVRGKRHVNCLVADEITCIQLTRVEQQAVRLFERHPGKGELLGDNTLPIVFAAHPEERRLIEMINICLSDMEASGFFREHLENVPYEDVVQWDCWLPSDTQFHVLHSQLKTIQKHLKIDRDV